MEHDKKTTEDKIHQWSEEDVTSVNKQTAVFVVYSEM